MFRALRSALTIARRIYRAFRRISTSVAMSPALCLRLFIWRISLPFLKYIVPMRLLTRFMWAAPHNHPEPEVVRARLEVLNYVWQHGGRLLVSSNCLERSLILYRLLSEAGSNPSLVFGVSRGDQGITGHAWVETQGRACYDEMGHRYDRLATFGTNGQAHEIPS